MSKEIRWLNEAKTPLEEVNKEEQSYNNKLGKALIQYKKANNITQKDEAVADALNTLTGTKAGTELQKSLGPGFLSRFITAFKWGSMSNDNLFIRLLERIFHGYNDADVVQKILSGKRPTAERDMETKVNQSNLNKEESLEEATLSPSAVTKLNQEINTNRKNRLNRSTSKNTNYDSVDQPIKNNNDNKQLVSKYNINQDEAKILDMSPRDMFLVLYNGYLNHLYTYEDLIDIDNDTSNNSTIIGRDGKSYTISKSLKNVIIACQNDENAFAYDKEATSNYSSNSSNKSKNYRNIRDIKKNIINDAKSLSAYDRREIVKEINSIT